jgi:hypothetical protein
MHNTFLKLVRRLDTDYEPFGETPHDGNDCSSGCRHFIRLAHEIGNEWGVCTNSNSPRAGLLTFERQGCAAFEPTTVDPNLTDAQLRRLIGEASQLLQDRRLTRHRRQLASPATGGRSGLKLTNLTALQVDRSGRSPLPRQPLDAAPSFRGHAAGGPI